jgi:transposase
MGRKKDLTSPERAEIVRLLSIGNTTNDIAKTLGRDHRTIKKYVQRSEGGRKKRDEPKRRKISDKQVTRLKREATKTPLASSAMIFKSCGIDNMSRSGRCKVLRELGQVKKAQTRPRITAQHREKRLNWARTYQKCDFSKVLWTDEMRVTLDGPEGWARGWVMNGQQPPIRLRRQQGGGGLMVWAAIYDNQLIGPFRVPDGVKLNSQNYCDFLWDNFFKKWYNRKSRAFKKSMIFMQDNAPSHASKYSTAFLAEKGIKGDTLMIWPPCSPDLNPIENLWSILKRKIYHEGQQYSTLTSLWDTLVAVSAQISPEEIKKLTSSMDNRLLHVVEKKGGYIGH